MDTTDFTVAGAAGATATTATATAVTGNGSIYVVTVSGGNLDDYNGTVGLAFATGQNIADDADNALDADLPTDANYETYTLDNAAASGCQTGDLWCTEMTVGANTASSAGGYCDGVSGLCSMDQFGSLGEDGDDEFDLGTNTYQVRLVGWGTSGFLAGDLFFELDGLPAASVYRQWTLHIGDDQQSFAGHTAGNLGTNIFNYTDYYTTTSGRTAPADGTTVLVRLTTAASGSTEAPSDGLQARFGPRPSWHTGMPFWTELHFSAEPDIGYKDLRDKALEATGARITAGAAHREGQQPVVAPAGGAVRLRGRVADAPGDGGLRGRRRGVHGGGRAPGDGPRPRGAGTGRPAGGAAEGHDVATTASRSTSSCTSATSPT